jgi:hypothetical protein
VQHISRWRVCVVQTTLLAHVRHAVQVSSDTLYTCELLISAHTHYRRCCHVTLCRGSCLLLVCVLPDSACKCLVGIGLHYVVRHCWQRTRVCTECNPVPARAAWATGAFHKQMYEHMLH